MDMLAEAGLMVMDVSTAAVTVSVVVPEMAPKVAVMMVEPVPTDVASPFEPDVLLIVATPVFEEFQVTKEETSWVVLSESVAIAMNCWVVPSTMLGFTGVTVIEVITAGVTVSISGGLVTLVNDATIVAVPWLTAVANP